MSVCPRCGTAFTCGMVDAPGSSEPCWCTRLPVLPPQAYAPNQEDAAASRCFCPHCLQTLLTAAEGARPVDR